MSSTWSGGQYTTHDELIAELALIEQMQVVERLKLAKKRRAQQLKGYYQREKQLARLSSSNEQQQQRQQRRSNSSSAGIGGDAKTRKSPISALNGLIGGVSGGSTSASKTAVAATSWKSSSKVVSSLGTVSRQPRLRFVDSVLLLDATIRNDLNEGKL